MIDIIGVTIKDNPCSVGQIITLSVDVSYIKDKYYIPTFYKILTSECEESLCTVGDDSDTYVRIADESNNILLDENGSILIYENINLVPTSKDSSGAIFNGTGYKDNTRINSKCVEAEYTGFSATGFIPYSTGQTIRLKGGTFTRYGCMIGLYREDFSVIHGVDYSRIGNSLYGTWDLSEDTAFTFACSTKGVSYIRISAEGKGADFIVTIDKPI